MQRPRKPVDPSFRGRRTVATIVQAVRLRSVLDSHFNGSRCVHCSLRTYSACGAEVFLVSADRLVRRRSRLRLRGLSALAGASWFFDESAALSAFCGVLAVALASTVSPFTRRVLVRFRFGRSADFCGAPLSWSSDVPRAFPLRGASCLPERAGRLPDFAAGAFPRGLRFPVSPKSSSSSAASPSRVRLSFGSRPLVPSGMSRSVYKCGELE